MSAMSQSAPKFSGEAIDEQELVYFCEQHGVMNKLTDLKEKVDHIAKRV